MMYGFKKRFVAPILAGTKVGTIRAPRAGKSRHARPGDALQLKAGPRFRPLVFADTVCTGLSHIGLYAMGSDDAHILVPDQEVPRLLHKIEGADLDLFAVGDGFADWDDLCRFWLDVHGLREFTGSWIRWAGAEVKAR
jgi:hypothetical protein